MSIIRVTKIFEFEMAHFLLDYPGQCQNIHGHSYKLEVTVSGQVNNQNGSPSQGMVLDFGYLKKAVEPLVSEFDHALMVREDERVWCIDKLKESFPLKVVYVDFQPTTENLILLIVSRIRKMLASDLALERVKLSETSRSYAEWRREDNC